jgi:integrase
MRARLTKRTIDRAISKGAEAKLWDSTQRGLCLRIRARAGSGARAYWGVEYRSNGKKVWETLGGFGETIEINGKAIPLTIENARKEAARRRALDTAAARTIERKADPTLAAAADRWLRQHVNEHRSSRTAEGYAQIMHKHILPTLGSRPVSTISDENCRSLHYEIGKGGHHRTANLALAVLGSLLSWCGREPNPARGRIVKRYPERRRRRFFSTDELAAIGAAIKVLEKKGEITAHDAGFFRALSVTGCRPGELLGLTWDRVDLAAGRIDLGVTKTKGADPRGEAGLVVTPPLREILSALPRTSERVFDVHRYHDSWRRIAAAAGITDRDAIPYVLRHTYGTTAGMALLRVVSGLLGHSRSSTTERYAHKAEGPIEQAARRVAKSLAAALDGGRAAK